MYKLILKQGCDNMSFEFKDEDRLKDFMFEAFERSLPDEHGDRRKMNKSVIGYKKKGDLSMRDHYDHYDANAVANESAGRAEHDPPALCDCGAAAEPGQARRLWSRSWPRTWAFLR